MKYKLIMLDQPILVSDEEIKSGDSVLFNISSTAIHKNVKVNYTSVYDKKGKLLFDKEGTIKVVAGIPELPTIDFSALSEEDCKKIGWVDVEKEYFKILERDENIFSMLNRLSFIMGFKAAQPLNEKRYSEEDIRFAITQSFLDGMDRDKEITESHQRILKELSQPKVFDVEVEMEEYGVCETCNRQGYRHCSHPEECGAWKIAKELKISNNKIKILKLL